jgi:hypothetical protein
VEFHEEGTYYFRSGRQWVRLGGMPTSTQEARERIQAHDLAVMHGLVPADQPKAVDSIRDSIEPYLAGYAPGHQTKTVSGLRTTLNKLVVVIGNKRVSAVTKGDLKRFWQKVVDENPTNSWRTAHNECNKVRMFLVENAARSNSARPVDDRCYDLARPEVDGTPKVQTSDVVTSTLHKIAVPLAA